MLIAKTEAVYGQTRPTPSISLSKRSKETAQAEGFVPRRAGVTTRPDVLKKQWLRDYPEMRHWELVGPFATYWEAEGWERRQRGCEKSGSGDERNYPGARWYGYRFDY